jgi:hypothetical protein
MIYAMVGNLDYAVVDFVGLGKVVASLSFCSCGHVKNACFSRHWQAG